MFITVNFDVFIANKKLVGILNYTNAHFEIFVE